ncbi:hypothetical protein L7F22_048235 [Adiantum nelumboides]|nr:hypothetical protein [Adiantum nelumboides]
MNTNCFGGEVRLANSEPVTQLNGLWLLPSFINDSCTPNASRLYVKKAMLILIATDIQANEEITISYTDCFLPVYMRDEHWKLWDAGSFASARGAFVSEPFQALHDDAVDKVFSLVKRKCSRSASFHACIELSKLFAIVSKKVERFDNVSLSQKQWILASYSYGFLGKPFAEHLSGDWSLTQCVSCRDVNLVEPMKCTAPGTMRSLAFSMMLATSAKKQSSNVELIQRLHNLALDECHRVYGKQRLDVNIKLRQ